MDTTETTKKPFYKLWWFWVIVAAVVLVAGGIGSAFDNDDKPDAESSSSLVTTSDDIQDDADNSETNSDFMLDLSALPEYGAMNIDTGSLKLQNGELLSVNYGGNGVIVVKAKIKSILTSNDMTVKQNYHSVCDLILNHGFNACSEIQFWAVADMTNGEEQKVISFTVNAATIQGVYRQTIVASNLADYLDDLYIHSSLQ